MSKYIIDTKEYGFSVESVILYGRDSMNEQVACATSVLDLEKLNSDYINENFGNLQDTAYQRGLEDGKVVREKGCEGCAHEGKNKINQPCVLCCNAFKNQWTAKDDKIEVGDEIVDKNGNKTIVTYIYGGLFDGLCFDGSTITNLFLDDNHKTGRHFDIDKILDEIKGNNDK